MGLKKRGEEREEGKRGKGGGKEKRRGKRKKEKKKKKGREKGKEKEKTSVFHMRTKKPFELSCEDFSNLWEEVKKKNEREEG